MKIVHKKESFGASAQIVLSLLIDEINPINKSLIYSSINLSYCPRTYIEIDTEVEIRLANSVAENIRLTSLEFNFEFKVIGDDLYIYNGICFKKIDNQLLLHFVNSVMLGSNALELYPNNIYLSKHIINILKDTYSSKK